MVGGGGGGPFVLKSSILGPSIKRVCVLDCTQLGCLRCKLGSKQHSTLLVVRCSRCIGTDRHYTSEVLHNSHQLMAAWALTMHRHTNIVSFWQVQTTTLVQIVCLSTNQALASSTMLGLDALHTANIFVNHPALKSV